MNGEVYWKFIPFAMSLSSFSFFHLLTRGELYFLSHAVVYIIHNSLMILIFTFDEGICILNALPLFLGPLKNIYCDAKSLSQFFSLFMNQMFQRALTV